tara:strand:+ start:16 stop:606 length:591 start_codon:yes stop_codon:yes gene_type:complete
MPIAINGSGTLTGVSVGGLPDGIVDTDMLAANAVTAAKATGSVKGITMADQWRLNSNFANNNANVINANWERVDNTYWSGIGSQMTESSGIFSFPTTGIYLIEFTARGTANGGARQYAGVYIQTGVSSTYTNVADSYGNCAAHGYYFNCFCSTIFDVTNTTTHTVRFNAESSGDCNYQGNTTQSQTFVTFTRLGDT